MQKEETKHTTHEGKEEDKHQEGVSYKPMGKPIPKLDFEKEKGHYDDWGFYILEEGGFYDPWGYKFDKDGYDEFGGYYDNEGNYWPGEEYADEYYGNYQDEAFDDYYDYGEEEAEEEPEYPYNEDDAIFYEHIAPAIDWLKKQPDNKKYVVKISNVSQRANETNIEKFLRKKIKDLKFSRIVV